MPPTTRASCGSMARELRNEHEYHLPILRIRRIGSPLARAHPVQIGERIVASEGHILVAIPGTGGNVAVAANPLESMTKIVDACIARASDDTIERTLVKAMSSTFRRATNAAETESRTSRNARSAKAMATMPMTPSVRNVAASALLSAARTTLQFHAERAGAGV